MANTIDTGVIDHELGNGYKVVHSKSAAFYDS